MTAGTNFTYFYINSLSGGINQKDSPLVIADNEMVDCLNATITSTGAIAKREGYTADSSHTITGSTDIESMYRFYSSGTAVTVVSAITTSGSRKIYKYDTTTGFAEITGGTALGSTKVYFKDYHGWLHIYNGVQWQCYQSGTTKYDVGFDSGSEYIQNQTDVLTMEVCDNRLQLTFSIDPDMLYYSDYGGWLTDPKTDIRIPTVNSFPVPERTNDNHGIIALKSFGNNDELFLARENDSWVELGVGTDDYRLMKVRGYAGCISREGIVEIDDGRLIIVGNDRIFMVESNTMYSIADKIYPLFKNLNMTDAVAVYDAKNNLVLISYPNGTLCFNISRYGFNESPVMAWTRWDMAISSACHFASTQDGNKVYITVPNDTHIYQLGGNSDNGQAIHFRFTTKMLDFSEFAETKQVHGLKTLQKTTSTHPFDVTVTVNDNQKSKTIPMELTASGTTYWGGGTWSSNAGVYHWSGVSMVNGNINLPKDLVGEEFSLTIESYDTQPLTIYRMAIELIERNRRREKSA